MLEPISCSKSPKVNDVISALKSSPGLPFRALLSPPDLQRALDKTPAFRDRVFPP